MTNSEFVSRIINNLNSLNKDSRIPRRFILRVGRDTASFYISQKLRDMSFRREANITSSIECFEMKPDQVKRCDIVEFRKCDKVMKSKNKLPKLIYSRLGASLQSVTTIDSEKEFKFVTPSQYIRNKKRKGESNYIYYTLKDNYLYILDSEIERLDLNLITLQTEMLDTLSGCLDEGCKSGWDYEFIVPDKLLKLIVDETTAVVANRLQIPEDENPNMDSNLKSKTVN